MPTIPVRIPTLRFMLFWQVAALILLLVLPGAVLFMWPWELPQRELTPFVGMLAAFGAIAVWHLLILRRAELPRFMLAIGGAIAFFYFLTLMLFLMRADSSRALLLAAFAVAVVVLPLPLMGARLRKLGVIVLPLVLIAAAAYGVHKRHALTRTADAQRVESFVSTNLYNLSVISHVGRIPKPAVRGGGFARIGGRVLLATGDGALYLLGPAKNELIVETFPLRVPLNGEEFAAATGRQYKEPRTSSEYGRTASPGVQTWRFRVAGLLVQDLGDGWRILASHHYWRPSERCIVIRVSAVELARNGMPQSGKAGQWRTLFETTPCLPLTGKDAKRGKNPFQGEEVGGRMTLLDDRTLLLTTGDLSFSGLESWQVFSQDPKASYGKTLRIDLRTGASEVFTLGHRNPQGLWQDRDGTLWETEHGPRGGDELNLLRKGTNYGWPRVTYGTDYGSFVWPTNPKQGRHEGFQAPVYAWVPSIGVSNLIRLSRDRFPGWKGDLLVGSLSTRSLYRLRVEEGRVIFAEPIALDERVRDLLELDDGRILVWTDTAKVLEISPTQGMNGALLFGSLCENCHEIRDGRAHRAGPDLFGIVGKNIASAARFTYSDALQDLSGNWNIERLDKFLADPQAVAPGTTMAFPGIEDERQRALVIGHLRKAR